VEQLNDDQWEEGGPRLATSPSGPDIGTGGSKIIAQLKSR
jgi:hypothetical protein